MAKYIDLPNLKENLTNFLNKKINPIYAKKTEIPSNVSELNNDKSYQTAEEVGQAVTDGVARIVAGAPEDFDTLKEMSDWISSHETSAAAMNSAISDNSVAIANHTSNSDIHVTKEEKTKWNKLDSDLKDGTIIVAEATKATQDAKGNVIDTTYAKKTEVPQGTVVDDALSSTSTNPVQNKVVKAEFGKVNSNLVGLEYSEIAGGKNLFKEYVNMNGYSISNEKYNGYPVIYRKGSWDGAKANTILKAGKTYIVTVYSKGTGQIALYGSTSFTAPARTITSDWIRHGWVISVTSDTNELRVENVSDSGETYIACMQIEEGTQATDYEPYIPSVKILADENAQQNDSLTSLGKCKNLLKPTLQTTTQNGVTCTANGDGTYTLNGTKTIDDAMWFILGDISLKANTSYKLIAQSSTDASTDVRVYDNDGIYFGEGTYRGTTPIITPTTDISLSMQIRVAETTALDNFIVKPMITTNLDATYDDFVPYTGDGDTLTHDVANVKNDLNNYALKSLYGDTTINVGRLANSVVGNYSTAEGNGTTASGESSHAEGSNTIASGYYAHAEGDSTTASGMTSHAEGDGTEASGSFSHAEGSGTTASGEFSHAEGGMTKASGDFSHAEGSETTASGNFSHAEGDATTASGNDSHAEGKSTTASASYTHAEGVNTTASGESSHAEGSNTTASGFYAHAEGQGTNASGDYSHAEGNSTTAAGDYQHVQGKYNIEDTEEKYAHIVGGGTSNTKRKNIHTVDWSGNAKYAGDVKSTNSYGNIISLNSLGTVETTTLTTTSGTATLYKLGKMRHLVLNNATFSSTTVLTSADASVGTLYFRAEVLFNSGDDLEGGSASFEDICISGSNMWNATRTATGASPVAVKGATGSATWVVQ